MLPRPGRPGRTSRNPSREARRRPAPEGETSTRLESAERPPDARSGRCGLV
jgi:hypothetical protein